jgi:hypothetical protein
VPVDTSYCILWMSLFQPFVLLFVIGLVSPQIELLLFFCYFFILNPINDSSQEVRESAGLAFSTLYKVLFANSLMLL